MKLNQDVEKVEQSAYLVKISAAQRQLDGDEAKQKATETKVQTQTVQQQQEFNNDVWETVSHIALTAPVSTSHKIRGGKTFESSHRPV